MNTNFMGKCNISFYEMNLEGPRGKNVHVVDLVDLWKETSTGEGSMNMADNLILNIIGKCLFVLLS